MFGPKEGYIYLLYAGGYYKIGKATKVDARARQLSLPFKVTIVYSVLVSDMHTTERTAHKMFKAKRLRGEWFDLSDEDIGRLSTFLSELEIAPPVASPGPLDEYLYTVEEVADHFKVSCMTIRRLARVGDLRTVRTGRLIRIPKSAIDEYVRTHPA